MFSQSLREQVFDLSVSKNVFFSWKWKKKCIYKFFGLIKSLHVVSLNKLSTVTIEI